MQGVPNSHLAKVVGLTHRHLHVHYVYSNKSCDGVRVSTPGAVDVQDRVGAKLASLCLWGDGQGPLRETDNNVNALKLGLRQVGMSSWVLAPGCIFWTAGLRLLTHHKGSDTAP
jgi:hypothetical protein